MSGSRVSPELRSFFLPSTSPHVTVFFWVVMWGCSVPCKLGCLGSWCVAADDLESRLPLGAVRMARHGHITPGLRGAKEQTQASRRCMIPAALGLPSSKSIYSGVPESMGHWMYPITGVYPAVKLRACILYTKRPSLEHFRDFYAAN